MYCHKCGIELGSDMQFCPACGSKVITEQSSAQNNLRQVQSSRISIPLLGKQVPFDATIEGYITIRKAFEELGEEICSDFTESFYSEYRDMDDLMKRLDADIGKLKKEGIGQINSLLSELRVYGVPDKEMDDYLQKYCFQSEIVAMGIKEQYNAILGRQEGMRQYRQVRKDSRGRVIGGGFGVSGAVKGMATAGAINMTTGALHSIGNAIGNMGSAMSAASAKSKLFNESNIAHHLGYALRDDIGAMHLVAVDILADYGGRACCKYTIDDTLRANKIYSDLKSGIISKYNQENAAITMLATDPFNRTNYRLMVELFPDKIESMREFFQFFGFDIDVMYRDLLSRVDPVVDILLEYKDYLGDLLADELDLDKFAEEPLSTNLEDMLEFFGDIFYCVEETGFSFLPERDNTGRVRLNGAKSNYAHYGNEIPLLLYDSTLGNSGKTGFLITNQHLYLKGSGGTKIMPLSNALEDIHQGVANNCTYLYFGDYGIHLLNAGDIVANDLTGDFIELIISLILFLSSIHMSSDDLWTAVTQYRMLPPPKLPLPTQEFQAVQAIESSTGAKQFCFECGAENDASAEFCFECGASLT